MNISHFTRLLWPSKKKKNTQLTRVEPVLGSKFDKWELEECSFKKGKVAVIKMAAFFSSYCFWSQDGCPQQMLKGQDHGFWKEVSLWGRTGASSCLLLPSQPIKRERLLTGSLNVNHGGVLLFHSSSVSLHFSWSWPQSEWRVFLLNVPSSNFYGRKKILNGKMQKKKITKKFPQILFLAL